MEHLFFVCLCKSSHSPIVKNIITLIFDVLLKKQLTLKF